jgi:hypothetical protein
MNFQARDKAIEEFRTDPDKKVLLCSLKAGGIGLNLTMASKVIILDLYWNECVEQQAYCRGGSPKPPRLTVLSLTTIAFRIGQEKEVEVVRFVVKNTIDSDMVAMQNRKTKEINMAIGDGGKSTRFVIPHIPWTPHDCDMLTILGIPSKNSCVSSVLYKRMSTAKHSSGWRTKTRFLTSRTRRT